MICETKATKGSAKSMQYQANDKGHAVEVGRNGLIGDEPKEWHKQMSAIESQYKRANFENKRVTQVISLTKEEAKQMKSGKDWEDLAKKHYEKKGIDLKNHAYIMHTHGSTKNPHLHITVSRVNFDGKMAIKDNRIGEEFGKITDKIAKERGWKTAKEQADDRKREVGKAINQTLQKEKVTDFQAFQKSMDEKGYNVKISENEAKGVYGMRVIPKDQAVEDPSPRLAKSGQGYKLSEIEKAEGSKAKFKIEDIKKELESNKILSKQIQYNRFDQMRNNSDSEKWRSVDKEINNKMENSAMKGEVSIQKMDEIIRQEVPKEFPKENVWAVVEKHGGARYQDKLMEKAENMQKEKPQKIEPEKPQIEQKEQLNRFDQATRNRENNQEQNQEKNRGFRR